ncbi:hypothetical protein RhiJN_02981 [Ceratobasidium sp. AG-Ba]|nr:hypothetical protein RhiJN_02981 [Ceratobasidium sp. AG-Ba]
MLRHKDFSACIFVDGKEVEYYNPRIKYDDSAEGRENFTVSWKDHRGIHHSSGHIFIDGKDVASAIMRRGRGKPVSRSGAKVMANKLRPFKFAHLNVTSDDTIADKKKDKEKLKEMSTIRLAITFVELGNVVPFKSLQVEDGGPVHEEAKALGLTTQYDPKIEIPPSRAVASRPLNPEQDGPDVQFVFTGWGKAHLMAADIIPNPNAPKFPENTVLRPIELDDDGIEVVNPSTPQHKRPRNNKRAGTDSDESDGQANTTQKRPRRIGSSPQSSIADPKEHAGSHPPGLSLEDEEDLINLQQHMGEHTLRNSNSDEEGSGSREADENDVESSMRVNDEESQDL